MRCLTILLGVIWAGFAPVAIAECALSFDREDKVNGLVDTHSGIGYSPTTYNGDDINRIIATHGGLGYSDNVCTLLKRNQAALFVTGNVFAYDDLVVASAVVGFKDLRSGIKLARWSSVGTAAISNARPNVISGSAGTQELVKPVRLTTQDKVELLLSMAIQASAVSLTSGIPYQRDRSAWDQLMEDFLKELTRLRK